MANSQVAPVLLEWKNVSYSVQEKKFRGPVVEKPILQDVSGYARPGQLTAILGASGAGKSSLLNVVADRLLFSKGARLEGEMLANRAPLPPDYRARCAYVLQTEALYPFSTVRETVEMAARLRLGRDRSVEEKKTRAADVIERIGLEKAMDTRVGDGNRISGLSGGERKRVSIACELVASPSLVMLDEPTSGLDSHQALKVVQSLKSLAESGRTVVASIHQPGSAIYALFDNVIVMAQGRTAYFGPSADLVTHFGRFGLQCPPLFNPADFVLQVTSGDANILPGNEESASEVTLETIHECATKYCNMEHVWTPDALGKLAALNVSDGPGTSARARCSYREQFALLVSRVYRDTSRNVFANVAKLANGLVTAVIMVALYADMNSSKSTIGLVQNKQALLFFITIGGLFGPLFGTVQAFAPEVNVVLRERMANLYSVGPYYLAKLIVSLPFELTPLFLANTVSFWWLQLNHSFDRYVFFVLLSSGVSLCSIGLGFMLAVASNGNVQAASAAIGPIAIVLLLLGGFYITVDTIPVYVRWISKISYLSFAFEGLCINEFEGEMVGTGVSAEKGDDVLCQLFAHNDKKVCEEYAHNGHWENRKLDLFLFIVIWIVAANLLAFLVLLTKGPRYLAMTKPGGNGEATTTARPQNVAQSSAREPLVASA